MWTRITRNSSFGSRKLISLLMHWTSPIIPAVIFSQSLVLANRFLTSPPLRLLEHLLPDAVHDIEAENRKDIELFIDKQIQEAPRLTVLLRGKETLRKEICAKLQSCMWF